MIARPQRRHRPRQRGQAIAELALTLPFILLIAFGSLDISILASDQSVAVGAVRAGLRIAVNAQASDVGTSIRQEAGSSAGLGNNVATWGWGASGGCSGSTTPTCSVTNDYGDCTTSGACGDPNGCIPSSNWWTANNSVKACFSVGSCTITVGTSTTCPVSNWGLTNTTRPSTPCGTSPCTTGIAVIVSLKVSPLTPSISNFLTNNAFYISATQYGQQLY